MLLKRSESSKRARQTGSTALEGTSRNEPKAIKRLSTRQRRRRIPRCSFLPRASRRPRGVSGRGPPASGPVPRAGCRAGRGGKGPRMCCWSKWPVGQSNPIGYWLVTAAVLEPEPLPTVVIPPRDGGVSRGASSNRTENRHKACCQICSSLNATPSWRGTEQRSGRQWVG
mgnify:CR=1 FL=1